MPPGNPPDGCLQPHGGGPRGREGRIQAAERIRLQEVRDGPPKARALRQLIVPNLNEDHLHEDIEATLAPHEAEWDEDSAGSLLRSVADALSVGLPGRLRDRVAPISRSFLSTDRGGEDIARLMEDSMKAIADMLAGGDQSISDQITTLCLERMTLDPTRKTMIKSMAERFVRSVNPREAREIYATLWIDER
jgi:hypothetical protein